MTQAPRLCHDDAMFAGKGTECAVDSQWPRTPLLAELVHELAQTLGIRVVTVGLRRRTCISGHAAGMGDGDDEGDHGNPCTHRRESSVEANVPL